MKCYVVKDLMPEYEEGLCSQETKKEIQEHLAECEACRNLYEALRESRGQEEEAGTEVNLEEIRPFAKIQYRMKHLTVRSVIISIAFLVICVIFGILTFFQFHPELNGISYDTIKYYQKAKDITESFAKGDMETFLQGMLYGLDTGGQLNVSIYTNTSEFYEDTLAQLNALYNTSLAGRDMKIKVEYVHYYTGDVSSFYNSSEEGHGCGYSAWTKIIVDDLYIGLNIYMYNDDEYGVYATVADNGDEYINNEYFTYEERVHEDGSVAYDVTYNYDNEFLRTVTQCVDYANYFQDIISYNERANWELGLTQLWNREEESKNGTQLAYNLLAGMFARDCTAFDTDGIYTAQMADRISALMPQITVNESRMTNTGYDSSVKKITAVLFWSFTDQEGHTGILQKNFYYGPYGYEAVDDTEILLCDDGMTEELKEQVCAFFD